MSTRSRIGVVRNDGTIDSIYCHFDGYVGGVGKELVLGFYNERLVNKLIDQGDASAVEASFNPEVHPTEKCVFYARDKQEDPSRVKARKHSNFRGFMNYWEEYNYLFKDGLWWLCTNNGALVGLKEEIEKGNE